MPTTTQMRSATIRDLVPEQLPEIVMPSCEVRPILKGQTAKPACLPQSRAAVSGGSTPRRRRAANPPLRIENRAGKGAQRSATRVRSLPRRR